MVWKRGCFSWNARLGATLNHSFPAQATGLWTLHFGKRFLETLFVHSFSKATMPLSNLFKNCGYYYSAAALVAWDVARRGDVAVWRPAVAAFFLFEALNRAGQG